MANNCWYEMLIKGTQENCYNFLKKMKSYDENDHFYRIFDACVVDEGHDGESNYFMVISGDCAWSLDSCCRASGYSNGIDLFSVNTKAFKLKLEAYSEEPGFEFQEHYIYDNGKCIICECVDYAEWFWDRSEQTFEEYKKEMGECLPSSLTERDFNEEGYYYAGGFGDWSFEI